MKGVLSDFCPKRFHIFSFIDNSFGKPVGLRPADAGQAFGTSGRLRQFQPKRFGQILPKTPVMLADCPLPLPTLSA
ncbi:MAG: hypothetical protein MUD08_19565 [Cytophagales bacterium]|nr:hypothetical protein [Cytophagales bacterium]